MTEFCVLYFIEGEILFIDCCTCITHSIQKEKNILCAWIHKLAAMNGKQISCQTSKHSDIKEKATLIYLSFRTGSVVFEAHLASVGRCIGEGDVATARSVNCKLTSRFAGFQILKRNKQSLPLIVFLISWCSSGDKFTWLCACFYWSEI